MLSELFFYFKHRQASLIYGLGKKDYPNNMLTPNIDIKKNVILSLFCKLINFKRLLKYPEMYSMML